MTLSEPNNRGKIRQRTRVNTTPVAPGAPGRPLTIITEADLERQYGTFATLYQPFQQVYTIYPATADELALKYGWKIYDTMMMDAQIAGCIYDIVDGAINDRPHAVPVDGSRLAAVMADWVNKNLKILQHKTGYSTMALFRQVLRDALVYGHNVSELVFDEVEVDGIPAYVLRKIVPLLPTRYSFRMSSEGDVLGIVPFRYDATGAFAPNYQSKYTVVDQKVVPAAKLLHLIWDRQGLFPQGRSILISAFKAWAMKQEFMEHVGILAKRIRKSWLGILPADARRVCLTNPETGEQEVVDPRQDLLDVLQALANGEGGVVPNGTEVKSFDIEVNGAGQYFLEVLKYLDRSILRAIYRRMLANNNDAAASTTGEFDRNMTSKVVKTIRNWFEDSLYSLSYALCYFTFGQAANEYAPRLVVGRGDGLPITVQDIALLHQSGWFTRQQKAALDTEMGMPPDDGGDIIGVNANDEQQDERPRIGSEDAPSEKRLGTLPRQGETVNSRRGRRR